MHKPKPKLDDRGQKLMQLLREMPKASRQKVTAQVRAMDGRPTPMPAMPIDPPLPPLEEPILPDWTLCGGLKRHYQVTPYHRVGIADRIEQTGRQALVGQVAEALAAVEGALARSKH